MASAGKAAVVAVKPMREPRRELQSSPLIEIAHVA